MNRSVVEMALEAQGWTLHKDKTGGAYALRPLDGCVASLNFDAYPDGSMLLNWSVSDPDFSAACQHIQGSIDFPLPLSHWQKFADAPVDLETEIGLGTRWAQSEALEAMIDHHADAPPDRPGIAALYHLAGLAVRSRTKTLAYYRSRFAAGDRLGFPPYVTDAELERAMALAGKEASAT